jgi:hypothetical protein
MCYILWHGKTTLFLRRKNVKSYLAEEFRNTGVYQDCGSGIDGPLVTSSIILGHSGNNDDIFLKSTNKDQNIRALSNSKFEKYSDNTEFVGTQVGTTDGLFYTRPDAFTTK